MISEIVSVGILDYEDKYVWGQISYSAEGELNILDWNSKNIEKGGTKKSIEYLRYKFNPLVIVAVDCGYDGEESFSYWKHMLDFQLIDGFIDDNAFYYE
jgi:hypothetical protein